MSPFFHWPLIHCVAEGNRIDWQRLDWKANKLADLVSPIGKFRSTAQRLLQIRLGLSGSTNRNFPDDFQGIGLKRLCNPQMNRMVNGKKWPSLEKIQFLWETASSLIRHNCFSVCSVTFLVQSCQINRGLVKRCSPCHWIKKTALAQASQNPKNPSILPRRLMCEIKLRSFVLEYLIN